MPSACAGRAAGPVGGRPGGGTIRRPPWPATVTAAAGSHLPENASTGRQGGSPIVHARSTKCDGFSPGAEDWRERREPEESRTGWMVVKRSFARTALSHRICTGISQPRLGFLSAELASPWMAQQGSRLRERRGHERLRAEGGGPAQSRCHTDEKGRTFATPSYGTSASSTPSRSVCAPRRTHRTPDTVPAPISPLMSPSPGQTARWQPRVCRMRPRLRTHAHLRREVPVAASRFRTSITFMSARSAMRATGSPAWYALTTTAVSFRRAR